jgi:hypothetical protein
MGKCVYTAKLMLAVGALALGLGLLAPSADSAEDLAKQKNANTKKQPAGLPAPPSQAKTQPKATGNPKVKPPPKANRDQGTTPAQGSATGAQGVLDPQLVAALKKQKPTLVEANVVAIGRDQSGLLVWLEKGIPNGGLDHILTGHKQDFQNFGIPEAQLPQVILQTVTKATPALKTNKTDKKGRTRHLYRSALSGRVINVLVGADGFIITAFPSKVRPPKQPSGGGSGGSGGAKQPKAGGGPGGKGNPPPKTTSGTAPANPGTQPAPKR